MTKETKNIIYFDFKKKRVEKDLQALKNLLESTNDMIRQQAIDNIDEVLDSLEKKNKDLLEIFHWEQSFTYSGDINILDNFNPSLDFMPNSEIVQIHKRDYEKYKFLTKLVEKVKNKYD
tara:strand:- start:15 stop:371 length:357 start_codon:yes stop_codon:yes gene_type:complete